MPIKEQLEKLFSDIQNMNSALINSINKPFDLIERKMNDIKKIHEILKNRTNSVFLMPIKEQLEKLFSDIQNMNSAMLI